MTGTAGEYGGRGWRVGELRAPWRSRKEASQEPKVDPGKVIEISQAVRAASGCFGLM